MLKIGDNVELCRSREVAEDIEFTNYVFDAVGMFGSWGWICEIDEIPSMGYKKFGVIFPQSEYCIELETGMMVPLWLKESFLKPLTK